MYNDCLWHSIFDVRIYHRLSSVSDHHFDDEVNKNDDEFRSICIFPPPFQRILLADVVTRLLVPLVRGRPSS